MRRVLFTLAIVSLVAAAGCHRDKYNLTAKFEEDYVLPPDEARFNNPPESGYRKPTKKREADIRNSPGIGSSNMAGSNFNNNGLTRQPIRTFLNRTFSKREVAARSDRAIASVSLFSLVIRRICSARPNDAGCAYRACSAEATPRTG